MTTIEAIELANLKGEYFASKFLKEHTLDLYININQGQRILKSIYQSITAYCNEANTTADKNKMLVLEHRIEEGLERLYDEWKIEKPVIPAWLLILRMSDINEDGDLCLKRGRPLLKQVQTAIVKYHHSSQPGKTNLSFMQSGEYVYIYAKKCHCSNCRRKHGIDSMTNKTAVVETLVGNTIEVNVLQCDSCKKYFMNYEAFKIYHEKYGGLLFEHRFEEHLWLYAYGFSQFKDDTILSRHGYTVKEGTPVEYRHRILKHLLDSGKSNKTEMNELITRFIRMHPQYEGAQERWKEDLEYVNNYDIENQDKIFNPKFVKG